MGFALFVIGPAGSGKTTFCQMLREHYNAQNRRTTLVNLDPAQIHEDLAFDIDIRDHIELADIMEEADFGPNGGLMAGIEAVADNLDIMNLPEDDDVFLIFDCPGQIELYIHSESMKTIVEHMKKVHYTMAAYALDSTHAINMSKFVAGALSATIAMAKFEVPHINIFTKCDLVKKDEIEGILFGLTPEDMQEALPARSTTEKSFNVAMSTIISDNGLLSFIPLNYKDEATLETIAYQIDTCIQYYDNAEIEAN
ncbi:GPN-loop GTPase [Nematocida sp. AWRm80]|nr:GPN-loop GTPase [Nematocida sp. AWRm80]